jgi:predicted nucleotidyltransferase
MLKQPPADPVLTRFRAAIDETYRDRVERVVLFGSCARGWEQPDSDYDIAVFLRDLDDRETEMNRRHRDRNPLFGDSIPSPCTGLIIRDLWKYLR